MNNRKVIPIEYSAILVWGQSNVARYAPHEYVEALVKVFATDIMGFIALDSNPRGQAFTAAGAAWAVQEGYLYISQIAQGDQEQVTALRLTYDGIKYLFQPSAETKTNETPDNHSSTL